MLINTSFAKWNTCRHKAAILTEIKTLNGSKITTNTVMWPVVTFLCLIRINVYSKVFYIVIC